MKRRLWLYTGVLTSNLILPAVADTIYSNLQDVAIPLDFTGVTITLAGGGTVNTFFGGVGVANNNLFQPVRTGTTNLSSIANLAVGTTIDINDIYSTANGGAGYGGSQTHLGAGKFVAGQEGYLGFKLNGANFGWMRVVFTGNTSGAVIKDWAYDNSGQAINVGRVQQSIALEGTQVVTLSPGTGESFTLGSLITDTNGNTNSVVKTGAGNVVLSGTNTYSGTTTVSAGILQVNGSTSASSAVGVSSGGTLAGSGTVGGNATIASGGTLAPGNSPGVLTIAGTTTLNTGSMFEWQLDTAAVNPTTNRGVAYDGLNTSALAGTGAIFKIMLTGTQDFTDAFWNQTRTWTDIFKSADGTTNLSNWSSVFSGGFQYSYNGENVAPTTQGSFTITGSSLTWSAVPEPSSALVGLVILAGFIQRRRQTLA